MQHINRARAASLSLVTVLLFFISCFSSANELINGNFVEGEIATPGESGLWMFEATAGEIFSINVADVSNNNLAVQVVIYKPDGAVAIDSTNDNVVLVHNYKPDMTGTYSVEVKDGNTSSSRGFNETGRYRIYYQNNYQSEHGAIAPGRYVDETIDRGDIDSWQFTLNAGDIFTATIVDHSNSNLAMHGTIYNPDGTILVDGGNDTVQLFHAIEAPQSGTYLLVVKDSHTSSSRGHAETGAYRVYLAQSTISELGSLKNAGVVEDVIDKGDLDSWYFDAVTGQTLSITVTDLDAKNLAVHAIIFAPDGKIMAQSGNDNVLRFNTIKIQQTGRYIVQVQDGHTSSSRGNAETGKYQIRMTLVPIMKMPELPSIHISGPSNIKLGEQVSLTASLQHTPQDTDINWTVSHAPENAIATDLLVSEKETGPQTILFKSATPGDYTITSSIQAEGKTYTATHSIHVVYKAPTISLSASTGSDVGKPVILEAIVINDSDVNVNFNWVFIKTPPESRSELVVSSGLKAQFTPDMAGEYEVQFVASDTIDEYVKSLSLTATEVAKPAPPLSAILTAKASITLGSNIELDGSDSDVGDRNQVEYRWSIQAKPENSLLSVTNGPPRMSVTPDKAGSYTFTLTITDGTTEDTAYATVAVQEPETPKESLSCDTNGDYFVDLFDIERVGKHRGNPVSAENERMDINRDRIIDSNDTLFCENKCTYEGCQSALF